MEGFSGTRCNPVHPVPMADPFLLKWNGAYYAFATGPAPDGRIFPVLHSTDLVHWTPLGGALEPLADPAARDYWAPEVIYLNGTFYLYYAVVAFGRDHHIRVATSHHPAGPYRDAGVDLTGSRHPWAIDPHPFQDEDGSLYLFYTVEFWNGERIGSGNVVDRLVDPFTLAGDPREVTRPCAEWQEFMRARAEKGGVDWYTVEGPCVLRRGRRYYQLYSGGNYGRANYGLGYAVADHPLGPWTPWVPPGETEPGKVLRTRSPLLFGPGHNSVAPGPDNVELYCCYHAWQPDRTGRRMCLDRIHWHGDRLYIEGPTLGPAELPRQPWLRELGPIAVASTHPLPAPLPPEALVEVNLCAQESDTAQAGVALAPGVEVLVDYRRGELTGPTGTGFTCPLPAGFRKDAFHQLLLHIQAGGAEVWLDRRLLGRFPLPGPLPGPWALVSRGGCTLFAGITVTAHLRLSDPLYLAASDDGPACRLLGTALPDYEVQMELRLAGPGAVAGLCAWRPVSTEQGGGPEALALLQRRQDRWYLATVVQDASGTPDWQYDPLPLDWDPGAVHHLRAVKTGRSLAVYLDGTFWRLRNLPEAALGPGRCGPVALAGEASVLRFERTGIGPAAAPSGKPGGGSGQGQADR
ncbi:MAG: glycoside hydrolase family 43 protein [Firmicutes bacterium]|nr:glycoside hydrolase family 43 protein [Bacillota bacterium]